MLSVLAVGCPACCPLRQRAGGLRDIARVVPTVPDCLQRAAVQTSRGQGDHACTVPRWLTLSSEPFLEVRWYDAGAKVAAAGQTAVVRFDESSRRIVRPLGAHDRWDIPLARFGWGDERPESAAPHGSEMWVTVHYLDANGFWWSRTGNDRPVRLLHGPSEPVIHD